MADAIGSVRATFTASAGGMIGAVDQIVGKLGSFAAATKRVAADTTRFESVTKELASEFMRGGGSVDDFGNKLGNTMKRFAGVSEAERLRIVMEALETSFQGSGRGASELAEAQARATAAVRAGTSPIERLSVDLAKNRADFLAGKVSMEQYKNTIATLPAEINGVETEQQQMERVFKETQETLRKLRTPLDDYETEMGKLREQLKRGTIDEHQFTAAAKNAKDVLDKSEGSAKSLGDAFGGLPGPLGAAARAFDMMQKSMGGTLNAFKTGGIEAGVSNFVGQIQSGVSNAGSTGGASLIGIAPQLGMVAAAAYAGYEGLKRMTEAMGAVGERVERTGQLAERMGVSFQEFELLSVAANMAGVETEALASAQTKGLKAISAARAGAKEQALAFSALGISQKQLQESDPSAILEDAAAKLNAIGDPATRAALAMKIFGKSGNDVLPALKGIDAVRAGIQRLGGVMNEGDVGRFKALDDAFDNATRATTRLGEVLLLPFTELFAGIANGSASAIGGLASALRPLGSIVADIFGAAAPLIEGFAVALNLSLRAVGALFQAIENLGAVLYESGAAQFLVIAAASTAAAAAITSVVGATAGIASVLTFVPAAVAAFATLTAGVLTYAAASIASAIAVTASWAVANAPFIAIAAGLTTIGVLIAAAIPESWRQSVVESFKSIGGWVAYIVEKFEAWTGIKVSPLKGGTDREAIEEEMARRKELEKENEQAQNKAAERAKAMKESLLSPWEQMQQKVDEVYDLEKRGLLTAQERAALENKITNEFVAQTPAAQALKKIQEDQKKASEEIASKIRDSAKAGAELGAAADPIRAQFASAAEQIKKDMEAELISPENAKAKMGEAVDAMNEELKRLGEDQKFAEKIRDGFKSEMDKVNEELAAIDKNQTLTAAEKDKAKGQVRDKAAASLPGGNEQSPVDKFKDDQKKLREAFEKGIIDKDQLRERMGNVRQDLEDSIADARDKQERNAGPDRRAVGATEVNSSEGASTFFRLLRGQDDPTKKQLKEMEKQTRLLASVEEALASQEVVQL